jgi:hypothetical protein
LALVPLKAPPDGWYALIDLVQTGKAFEMHRLRGSSLTVALIALLFVSRTALGAETISDLRFSKEELALLKRLDQIQTGAGIASSMLKAAPFVELLASSDPVEVAITVTTNDWNQIYGALTGLKKVAACKTVEEIDYWKDVDDNNYSSPKTEKFFTEVRSKANSSC